jgi:hypothetical protein
LIGLLSKIRTGKSLKKAEVEYEEVVEDKAPRSRSGNTSDTTALIDILDTAGQEEYSVIYSNKTLLICPRL